jgi:hypothetical protein
MKNWPQRFWDKTTPEPMSGCLLWTAALNNKGYGVTGLMSKHMYAHRVAWELIRGPIPEGLCALHRCDVPSCVNVEHLFLGTKAENSRDMAEKGRAWSPMAVANAKKTHCPSGHPYFGDNLYVAPGSGHRQCRICIRAADLRYRKTNYQRKP